jgi:FkbM family methyltransferase
MPSPLRLRSSTLKVQGSKFTSIEVGRHDFTVPACAEADCQAIAHEVLVADEYQLHSIRRAGHWPEYIVDIGGNCGAFALATGDIFPGAHLLWMEPYPPVAECYRRNTASTPLTLDGSQTAAAGPDTPESVAFRCFSQQPAGNCIDGIWKPSYEADANEMLTVPTKRLSSLLAEHNFPRIDLLKIDCEGSEANVLQDLHNTGWLHRTRWVRFEWHGKEQLDRCLALLHSTHIANATYWHGLPNGGGLAHSRLDEHRI